MFTGIMPSQCGMLENETPLPDSLKNRTLGNIMDNAGYRGVYAGKWHVNTNALPAEKAFGFERLHGHDDNGLSESVVDFLKSDRGDKPFFLVASFDNPHNICQYARGQRLPEAEIEEPLSIADCPNLPSNHLVQPYDPDILTWEREQSYRLYPSKGYTADDWRRYRNNYFRLVEHVDSEIAKIVDEIDRQNLWENTVVIFTSDHGDGRGAHEWNQKTALWEETANIPLIVCVPGNKKNAGKVTDARSTTVSTSCLRFLTGPEWINHAGARAIVSDVRLRITKNTYTGLRGDRDRFCSDRWHQRLDVAHT